MVTEGFTKAALLLTCCLFVPSNSIMPKPGHCRKYFESFAPLKPCHYDRDCPGADKCCVFDYGSVCAPPLPTTLQCPRPGIGLCVEECSSDDECPNGELCCSNGCGHQCMTPVSVKPGQCGWRSFIPVCGHRCQNDSDCGGEKKCCPKRCGRACEDPIFLPESQ